MTIWFTSDTHFGHKNIIKYCHRPFNDVDEMNQIMCRNWNRHVHPTDTVYHLGDVAFMPIDMHSLNGRIKLIPGNHDKKKLKDYRDKWDNVYLLDSLEEVTIGDQLIILCHYPMLSWNKSHRGSWHLFGHCHGSIPISRLKPNQMDVGVDCHGFAPISFEQVSEYMTGIKPIPEYEYLRNYSETSLTDHDPPGTLSE